MRIGYISHADLCLQCQLLCEIIIKSWTCMILRKRSCWFMIPKCKFWSIINPAAVIIGVIFYRRDIMRFQMLWKMYLSFCFYSFADELYYIGEDFMQWLARFVINLCEEMIFQLISTIYSEQYQCRHYILKFTRGG